jgi:hypothetical protein
VCSGLTPGVRQALGGIFSVVQHLPVETSDQLPDLG